MDTVIESITSQKRRYFCNCCMRFESVIAPCVGARAVLSAIISRAATNHDHNEHRDFGRVPGFLAVAEILRHGRNYRRIMYEIGTVQLL